MMEDGSSPLIGLNSLVIQQREAGTKVSATHHRLHIPFPIDKSYQPSAVSCQLTASGLGASSSVG